MPLSDIPKEVIERELMPHKQNKIYGKVCPRCWIKKWYYEFHLSGGDICACCFAETN